MGAPQFPQYAETAILDDKGVRMVETVVRDELGWIFREQKKDDLGVDAHIEVVAAGKYGTGRLIAVQIKCGESFFEEEVEDGFVYRGDPKHLHYWLDYSLPVIVVICDPSRGTCHWQEASSANTVPLEKGWKLTIPRDHLFSATASDKLISIAGKPQHYDIVEAVLFRHLHEKYINRVVICSLFELPRDYHAYAYLAKIDGETTMIDFHYDSIGRITVDDIQRILQYKDYNDRVCGPNPLHIYLVSRSRHSLDLSAEVTRLLKANEPDVRFFRAIYRPPPMPSLDEIDRAGKPVEFWPDSVY